MCSRHADRHLCGENRPSAAQRPQPFLDEADNGPECSAPSYSCPLSNLPYRSACPGAACFFPTQPAQPVYQKDGQPGTCRSRPPHCRGANPSAGHANLAELLVLLSCCCYPRLPAGFHAEHHWRSISMEVKALNADSCCFS